MDTKKVESKASKAPQSAPKAQDSKPEDTIEPEEDSPIAIDEFNDLESGYGTSIGSETTTISSTIYDYVYENGRRYHRYQEGKYVLPNDELEQDRLDVYHHISLLLLKGRLHLAPLKSPQRILDIGTGTGVWAQDMAQTYPGAQVIGTDLSPIQPVWVAQNCSFEVDDAEQSWMFPPDHFDFIHSRTLAQSIREWPEYMKQMFKHTKPGGYVELAEISVEIKSEDGTFREDSSTAKYTNVFNEACRRAGLRVLGANAHTELMQDLKDVGFVDIKTYKLKQPWGTWPKDPHLKHVGHCMSVQMETGLPAYATALFCRYMDYSAEESAEVCNGALAEIKNRHIHMFNEVIHVVGRKPGG